MTSGDRILVVDDEAVIRDLMLEILEDEGYSVVAVSGGPAALEVLRQEDGFVLLLTDIMMPDMNGIDLIREARRVRPDLIPIVMTGFATLETARAAVKEGAYDYVLKPFSLSEIKMAVSNAIDRHRLSKENARLLELTDLFNISETIASIRNEHKLLDFVLRTALEHVQAERGSIMLTTPDGKALEVAASVGLPDEAVHNIVKVGTHISGWVAEHVKPLLVEDLGRNPDVAEISRHLEDHSFISVPLERKAPVEGHDRISRHRAPHVIAVLNVSQKQGGGSFSESDLKTLSIVANHAAAAIDNVRLIRDLEDTHLGTLQSMAMLLEAKDAYTHGHSQRVCEYSVLLALKMGMGKHEIETLRVGAAFHDIGKVGINDAVLNKTDRLTDDEWAQIKRHPLIGYDILEHVRFLSEGHLELVRSHHERLSGRGYPDAMNAKDIPPLVRIISLADAYDAMSSDRAYRKALPQEKIIQEFERCRDEYDANILDLLIKMVCSGEFAQSNPPA